MRVVRRAFAALLFLTLTLVNHAPAGADGGVGGGPDTSVKVSMGERSGAYKGSVSYTRGRYSLQKAAPSPGSPQKTSKPDQLTPARRTAAFVAMCREAKEAGRECVWDQRVNRIGRSPEPEQMLPDLSLLARTLITRIQLPDPTPKVGPDPSVNEWNMVAVGYPIWLWTDGPTKITDQANAYGVKFTLTARRSHTHFSTGDGHSQTCTRTTKYPEHIKPGTQSPTCGYTYLKASPPNGKYTITATTNWNITWTALGHAGTIPVAYTGTRTLPVGELNALIVR